MNRLIFTTAMFFATLSYAAKEAPKENPFSRGLELPQGQYAPIYNAPAAVDVDGVNLDLWASFTYWNVSQQGMDVAHVPPETAETLADVVSGRVVAIENGWTPGFQVGIAYNTNYDGWVGSAEYTWVRFSKSVSAKNGTGFSLSQIFPSVSVITGATKVESDWILHLDQIDALISRPYYLGKELTASPFTGLRSLFIRQRQTGIGTVSAGDDLVVLKSQMWSIGPVGGVLGQWLLGKGVRFEGSMAASLLYSRYTTLSFNFTEAVHFPVRTAQNDLNAIRPALELGLGLGWGSYIFDRKCFLDFSAEYDFKYYWKQNMIRLTPSIEAEFETSFIGALMMHGLVLTSKVDF